MTRRLATLLLLPVLGHAAEPILDNTYARWMDGEPHQVAIGVDGRLEAAPALNAWLNLEEPVIWAARRDAAGNLYLGTGGPGRLLKVSPEGQTTRLWEAGEPLVRALALDAAGNLYAASAPGGAVYRLPAGGGPAERLLSPETGYIWALEVVGEDLWIATGQPARVLRLPLKPGAVAETWLETQDTHFTCLLPRPGGGVWVGSSQPARVYEVAERGRGRARYEAKEAEFRALLAGPEGAVIALAYDEAAPEPRPPQNQPPPPPPPAKEGTGELPPLVVNGNAEGAPANRPGPEEALQAKRPAGKGAVYRIAPDGMVETLLQSRQQGIFCALPYAGNHLLLGLNSGGRIIGFRDRQRWSLLQRAAGGGEVSFILPDPMNQAWLIVTSNPAQLYRLGGDPTDAATYTSREHDAGQPARWGKVEVVADPQLRLGIETRSGNTTPADATWSEWSAVDTTARSQSPVGRYLQYRLTWPREAAGAVHAVRTFPAFANLPPKVEKVTVHAVGSRPSATPEGIAGSVDLGRAQQLPDGRALFESQAARASLERVPDPGAFTAVWQASDGNDDPLRFRVALQAVGAGPWSTLAAELDLPTFSFSGRGLADGYYRLQVEADDSPAHAPGAARREARVSEPFLIDNTPPTIAAPAAVARGTELAWTVESNLARIVGAQLTIDGGTPRWLTPEDGIYDDRQERFRLPAHELPPEARSLVFEVIDEAGNRSVHLSQIEVKSEGP